MLLKYGRIDEDQSGALRLANYVLTGGQVFRWKRAEVGPGDEMKARMLDAISSVLDRGSWTCWSSYFRRRAHRITRTRHPEAHIRRNCPSGPNDSDIGGFAILHRDSI